MNEAPAARGDTPPEPGATPAAPLRALVEELVRSGLRDAVVCPGSRSTPLALALRMDPSIRTWVAIDERAGAYFALGAAKASRRAVAILATSGTAVANFLPAVVEAHEGRVPLVLLTADRPPELRDRGANQTIDQDHLYGRFAKWYVELPVPEESDAQVAHVRWAVGRAIAVAQDTPAGPVHLNLPFREPLVPSGSLAAAGVASDDARRSGPYTAVLRGRRVLAAVDAAALAERLRSAGRGLIVAGPLDQPGFGEAIARLAASTGFPILADALSNVRLGLHDRSHVVARHDALLRSDPFRAGHVPDLVVRFGGAPTSKALVTALQADRAPQIVVDDGGWTEPTLLPVTMVQSDPVALSDALATELGGPASVPGEALAAGRPAAAREAGELGLPAGGRGTGPAWLASWLEADRLADRAIRDWLGELREPFEGAAFAALEDALPDGTLLVAGNSMPVRDMDAFLPGGPARVRTLGNRGASGIDGVVSTALGASAVHDGPVVLVVGDLSFLHDLNALVAARLHRLSLTVVLVHNDGGGIFSFLPQASAHRPDVGLQAHFEELFGTPHGMDVGALATALGAEHRRLEPGGIAGTVADSVRRPGVRVLELRTDRARNVTLHRACTAAVEEALRLATIRRSRP